LSLYDGMANMISKRAGAFVAVVLIITGVMFLAFGNLEQDYDASSDPAGPAFEARGIIGEEFTATAHQIPFIIEARGKDVLTQEVLSEFHANEDAYRASDIYQEYRYVGYDVDLDRPSYGIYTVADGVQDVLNGIFNTTLDKASDDQVKVALHFFILGSPGITGTFSTDNSSTVEDISVGPMVFEDVRVWRSKAFINGVLLDFEKVEEENPDVLDREAINLEVLDLLSGDEDSYEAYGIALDLNTEINIEAQTSVMLVFVAVFAILVIVFISLRSGIETALAGLMLLFLLFWIFGAVRILGLGSSQFIDLLLPIAILSLGVDYVLHALHRYHEEKRTEPRPREAFRRSTRMVGPALFIAMVTTAVAFLSNVSSELEAVQQFGLAAGLAIIFAFILLGLALPAMRMLGQDRKYLKRQAKLGTEGASADTVKEAQKVEEPSAREPRRIWKALARMGTRPVPVIVIVVLITLPLAWSGMQIEGKMPVEDFINSESDFVVGLATMNKYFDTGEAGIILFQADYSDPEDLRALDTFNVNVKDNKEALGTGMLTITDLVRNVTVNQLVFPMYGNTTLADHLGITDDDLDGLPDTSAQVERVFEFMIEEGQGVPLYYVEDRVISHNTLSITSTFKWGPGDELDKTIIFVQIPRSGDGAKVAEARDELIYDLSFLKGMGYSHNEVTDDEEYYVITDVGAYNPFTREEQMTALTESMAKSVFISIALCLLVMVLLFKSVKLGVASILPMMLVVAWLYGVMDLTGHYLNSVTVTIAAISIGVGVDYAIHVTHRFREEYERYGHYEKAMTMTLASTGNALAFSAGSTFVGFLIIGLSPMTMFSKFGYLTAMMIGMAFIAAVVVLPAFLSLTVPKDTGEGNADASSTAKQAEE